MPMTAQTRGAGSLAACPARAEVDASALLADWFAHRLLAPMQACDVKQLQTAEGRHFVRSLGDALDCEAAAHALLAAAGDAPAVAEVRLSRDYLLLFEGINGPKSISLYESSHCGNGVGLFGAPFVEMQEILRALDIRLDDPCREPPDHLAIELAALAKALRLGKRDIADGLVTRLCRWTPSIGGAVTTSPHCGFYRHLFALLDAFLVATASLLRPTADRAPHAYQEADHARH
ncbi:cytoplasmic chaperone TorD family protein [Tardiphaga alba]|uniref:Cytoplasmic chaperone TorD family protein n=1 Tax=Tardiphaga alba TaxID=340268 RepID=A0ABX8A9T9_9BRAD|nr:molecular chaperone TorD family protein [Tardiphaga alba]QUS40086.1 cytoplasmic chaperone TorD family protein [Tardiphaga alba]